MIELGIFAYSINVTYYSILKIILLILWHEG